MDELITSDIQVLVLASGDTASSQNNAKGHLFEVFVARLLHLYGYEEPKKANVQFSSDGIEIDVSTRNRLTTDRAVAECKAYSRPVRASELSTFYGKLTVERFAEARTFGLMVAMPRLTSDGEEHARAIQKNDRQFLYLSAADISERLHREGLVTPPPTHLQDISDVAIVITSDGIFSAGLVVEPKSKTPTSVAVWSAGALVPDRTIELIVASQYSQSLTVSDASNTTRYEHLRTTELPETSMLVTVRGSSRDFEYQLPAAPKYFVGRKKVLTSLSELLTAHGQAVVLNAQSGWGKSSLALKFADLAVSKRGYAKVFDVRTASNVRYVVDALRDAAVEAEKRDLLKLPTGENWASIVSGLRTLAEAEWNGAGRPLLVFFDQFENIFKSQDLTRAFRDLAAGASAMRVPLIIGFAWKTDLVGWTEGHPYRLRDEIRSNSRVISVEPLGSTEVGTILSRLERELGKKLIPDLRNRLREYSQGLPWLLKKLSDHVIGQVNSGATQDKLLAGALNIQSLFDADLAQLAPLEHEAVGHVARYAPIPASEVTERYAPEVVQSLVDRRLIVQVGERLDIYWDNFRDYLNTGRVPIEDSYILRMSPTSVARILPFVMQAGGSASVSSLADSLDTSSTVVFNLSRELRLMGITAYEPNQVTIIEDIRVPRDQESAFRRRVAEALKRHKAFSIFRAAAERHGGAVSVSALAADLPRAFPAVEVKSTTWDGYCRIYLAWFSYAGLAEEDNGWWYPRPEGDAPSGIKLLGSRSPIRTRPAVPVESPNRAFRILDRLARGEEVRLPSMAADRKERDAIRALVALGALIVDAYGGVEPATSSLFVKGRLVTEEMARLLTQVPGGAEGVQALRDDPRMNSTDLGRLIRDAAGADWADSGLGHVGSRFRGWAKRSGIDVQAVPRQAAGGRRG